MIRIPRTAVVGIFRDGPAFCTMPMAGIFRTPIPQIALDVEERFDLPKRGWISQLQFLHALPVTAQTPYVSPRHTFPHDRLREHQTAVAVLGDCIARKLGLGQKDRTLIALAGRVHDSAMTAGGDMMKSIDPELFDEDRKVRDIFDEHPDDWAWIRERYRLPDTTPQDVEDIVNGKGILGNIHDIADTTVYLANDARELMDAYARMPKNAIPEYGWGILQIASIGALRMWEDAEISGDRVIIGNHELLAQFLRLRILFWKNLYQNPAHKVLECLMSEIVCRELFRLKKISRDILKEWSDDQLHEFIEQWTGIPGCCSNVNLFGTPPKMEHFCTWDKARTYEEQLVSSGCLTLMFDTRQLQKISAKTDRYFVQNACGRAVMFAEGCPSEAESIRAIAKSVFTDRPVHVASFPGFRKDKALKRFVRAWENARTRWKSQ